MKKIGLTVVIVLGLNSWSIRWQAHFIQNERSWEGNYVYIDDSMGRNPGDQLKYVIKVFRNSDGLIADIDEDGLVVVSHHFRCDVRIKENKMHLYLRRYLGGTSGETPPYNIGDLLLTLENSSASGKPRLLTYWGAISPLSGDRSKSGGVFFRFEPSASATPISQSNYLVFSSQRDNNQEVYLLDLTTGLATNLSQSGGDDGYPRCSPDGQRIAFATNRDGYWEIYLMNRDGSGQQNLTKNRDGNGYMDWSPDGRSLAFASTRNGERNNEIYTIRVDGSGLRRLTYNPAEDVHPTWSPDGRKIAFASERDGNRQIYVMNTDGTNLTRLMTNRWYDDYPMWSPDGKQIAFASDRDSGSSDRLDIYVVNADGSNVRRITSHPADDRHPAWSPDGSLIAFASNRDGDRDIFVVRPDGTGVKKVFSSHGNDEHPYWCGSLSQPKLNSAANQSLPGPSRQPHYFIHLFNCADGCRAEIGDVTVSNEWDFGVLARTEFGEDSGWIDFTDTLETGRNQIKLLVFNTKGAVAYGFQIRKDDNLVFEQVCGRAGSLGCENNRRFQSMPSGAVREFRYEVSVPANEVPVAYQRWLSFYQKLRSSVDSHDAVTLKKLICTRYDRAGGTPDGVVRQLNGGNGWRLLQKSLATGTRNDGLSTDNRGRPTRWTKDGQYSFQYGVDGQWRWCGENVAD